MLSRECVGFFVRLVASIGISELPTGFWLLLSLALLTADRLTGCAPCPRAWPCASSAAGS
jgi:hypothetical protein